MIECRNPTKRLIFGRQMMIGCSGNGSNLHGGGERESGSADNEDGFSKIGNNPKCSVRQRAKTEIVVPEW